MNKFEEKSEFTRTALFGAAQRVIAKDGYERAQLETIAKEAGRTKGSVYAHFRSKEDLFLAMMEFILAERTRSIKTLSPGQRGEKLRFALRALVVQAALDDDWLTIVLEYKFHAYRNPRAAARIRESHNQMWDDFQALLIRAAPHAGRTSEEAGVCLEILRAMPTSLLLEAPLRRRPVSMKSRRALLEKVFDLLFPAI